eukprot:scaffold120965_cov63-Phaeocystis_antarctica.AAC.6
MSGEARASRPSKAARAKAARAAPLRPRAPPPPCRAPPSLRGDETAELASADRPAIRLASGDRDRSAVQSPVSGDRVASEPGLPVSSSCGPRTGARVPPLDDLFSWSSHRTETSPTERRPRTSLEGYRCTIHS